MSNLNIEWLKANLKKNAIIFDIGCADLNDTIRLQREIPDATYYAFECALRWKDQNLATSAKHNINYNHIAVADKDDVVTFYPSGTLDGQEWPWSGSLCEPNDILTTERWSWGNPYTVPSITLNTFCEQHNIVPDFIHIDAQGAEYSIFRTVKPQFLPNIVWAEISEFQTYKTGITYDDFHSLMTSHGYTQLFRDNCDALYVKTDHLVSKYETRNTKKINYVFENKEYTKTLSNQSIRPDSIDFEVTHGPSYDTMYQLLSKNQLVNTYYHDKLPEEVFVYSYEHHWWISIEQFFKKGDGFLEHMPCPENVLTRIKNKTAYLIITIPMESPIQPDRISLIHEYFEDLNIPHSQIIYYTSSPNSKLIYEKFCQNLNLIPTLTFDYAPFYPFISSHRHKGQSEEYKVEEKKRDFLIFNRRWGNHPQRVLILYFVHCMNLLDNFYISFPKTEIDNGGSYTDHFKKFMPYLNINRTPVNKLSDIENQLPLILDKEIKVTDELMFGSYDSTEDFYNESMIHLIAETYFFSNIIHLTEKTFKPIAYKQPFIMFSVAGALKSVRDLGFKTFSSVWDESYDDEIDDKKRFFKIIKLIKHLCSLSSEQKLKLMSDCKPIIEFNHRLLYIQKKTFLYPMIKRLAN